MIIDFKNFRTKKFSPSSTFLLDHIKIVSVVFLVLIIVSSLFLDKPLALCFNSFPAVFHELFHFLSKLFCPIAWILILPAVFFYIRFLMRKEKKSRKIWYLSLVIPLSVLLGKILALMIGKANPEWFFLHGETPFRFFQWDRSFHSFPSMTALTIAAFGASLAAVFSNFRLPLLFAGLAFSFAPALATDCFLSDSLAGIYVGSIAAQWIFRKVRREISM